MEQCPICRSDHIIKCNKLNSIYTNYDLFYIIYKCNDCGHGFADGLYNKEILSNIYNSNFFLSSQQDASKDISSSIRSKIYVSPIEANAARRAYNLSQRGYKGRLIDIGAGLGIFCKKASKYFLTSGLEYSKHAVANFSMKGIPVYQGDLLKINLPEDHYDVATMWDVLACFKDVHAAVGKCDKILKRKGNLVLTIPHFTAYSALAFGSKWPLLIPPVNMHFFSRRSIIILLKQYGFAVEYIKHEYKLVSLQFLLIKLRRTTGITFFSNVAKHIPSHLSIPVNLGDILTVYARKTLH